MTPVSNADFAMFIGCVAALVIIVDRVLSVVIQWRGLTSRAPEGNSRPVTVGELRLMENRLRRLEMNDYAIMAKLGVRPFGHAEAELPEEDGE